MGIIGGVLKVVGLLILAVVGIAAFLYFTDYAAEAEIKEKGSDADGNYVVIRPKLIPRDFTQRIDSQAASFVCEGYQVTYRVQSGHYQVLDEQGRQVYDSNEGLTDAFTPIRCGLIG